MNKSISKILIISLIGFYLGIFGGGIFTGQLVYIVHVSSADNSSCAYGSDVLGNCNPAPILPAQPSNSNSNNPCDICSDPDVVAAMGQSACLQQCQQANSGSSNTASTTQPFDTGAPFFLKFDFIANSSGFVPLVNEIFKYSLRIIGILAFGAIVWGGVLWTVSSGNPSKIGEAKSWITGAILGIILLVGAYVILYTINSNLVQLKEPNLQAVPSGGTSSSLPVPPTLPPLAPDQLAAQLYGSNNITSASNGSCGYVDPTTGATISASPRESLSDAASGQPLLVCSRGCTSTSGCAPQNIQLNSNMLQATYEIAQVYPVTITSLTGGSHSGPDDPHYQGNAIDVQPYSDVPQKWQAVVDAYNSRGLTSFCEGPSGQMSCSQMPNPVPMGSGYHIHSQVKK